MSKPRVHEISKIIKKPSKDIIDVLETYDIEVKNHMSTLEPEEIDIILDHYAAKSTFQEYEKIRESEKMKQEKKRQVQENSKSNNAKFDKNAENKPEPKKTQEPVEEIKSTHKKKNVVVDTRQSFVDVEKYETEKIEELISDNLVSKKEMQGRKKQSIKKSRSKQTDNDSIKVKPVNKVKKKPLKVKIPDEIKVATLAERLKKNVNEVIKKLMSLGVMATINEMLDFDTASIVAEEFGAKVVKEKIINEEEILFKEDKSEKGDMVVRAPVVVVMGHVDHGKTSLLDAIRNTNVIDTEAGGITQHIGAHTVVYEGNPITFLDTPGHEAFTTMRARGAKSTDIAILVVAADDGVMPQTVEAINHAKAAGIDMIIAINKMDKEGANPDRIKQELTEYEIVPEDWGGSHIFCEVSALKNEGIEHLLEMVLLTAEIKELKADPSKRAKGIVIESKLDKGRGPVATILIQDGTLHSSDIVVAGVAVGKVRAMFSDKGEKIETAGPSTPVEILGLSEVPTAGDEFRAVEDEKMARSVVDKRKQKIKESQLVSNKKVSLDDLFAQMKEGEKKELNIIIKADVQGSVEAVRQSFEKISNDEVNINVIHGAVGAINESDVMLASASDAIIVGFNVRPSSGASAAAKNDDVEIRTYRIIYNAIEDIEMAMKGMLEPNFVEKVNGHVEIREIFKVSGVGTIGGSYVLDGKINRNDKIRVVRDGIVIHEGELASLKRFKDDAKEVAQGYECGISVNKFNDIKEGDIIESFFMEEVKR